MNDLQKRHLELLRAIVEVVDAVNPLPWEGFMARRINNSHTRIYHSRSAPIHLDRMEDLDVLTTRGWIDLHRLPSGACVFMLTKEGRKIARSDDSLDFLDHESS